MGKKSPETVPAPSPEEIARTDAEYNRINQITPWGNLTYSGPRRNTATLSLIPELQAKLDNQLQLDNNMVSSALARLAGFDENQIDLSQFGPIQSDAGFQQFDPSTLGLPGIPTDLEAYRSQIEDATMSRMNRLMNPQFERMNREMEDRLANQGLPQTGEAYLDQRNLFDRNRINAYADVAERAVLGSGAETSRLLADALGARSQLFGEGYQTSAYNNELLHQALVNANAGRSQGMQEAIGLRGNDFNELASLLGLQQVAAPQMSSFFQPGMVDVMGANQLGMQANMFNAQQRNQANQAALGGLYGMGATALSGGMEFGLNPNNWGWTG